MGISEMNDRDTPAERPPYWETCEQMSFAQLRRYIHDAVERLSYASASTNEDLPRSQEEFLDLCEMLQCRAEVLKEDAPMPKQPTYEGPPDPGWSFTPSDELDALYREQRRAQKRVDYEIEHGESDIYLDYIKRELEEVERKIAPIERCEEEEHEQRVREYEEAREPYRRSVRLWSAEVQKLQKRREAEAKRDDNVQRTYREVKRAFGPTGDSGHKRVGTLPFEIAPPGERTNDHVYAYYREVLRRGQLAEFDRERLDKVLALPRSGLLKGKAGFYGYIVLQFDHTDKVLLECPVYRNALYVLDCGEERLLTMNKQELIASDEAKRIVHTGDWYRKVKQELGIR
jgi:hypothetical protein